MSYGDWNTQATWDAWYHLTPRRISKPAEEPDLSMGYARASMFRASQTLASTLVSAFGWTQPGPTILIYGCGYGWVVEILEGLGFTRVVGADVSQWIADRATATEESEIDAAIAAIGLDPSTGRGALHKAALWDPGNRSRTSRGVKQEDGYTVGSRNRLKQSVGLNPSGSFDWVLSEYLVEVLTDAELAQALPHYDAIGTNKVHVISGALPVGGNQETANWKGPAGWRTFLDGLGFSSHQILVGPTGARL